MRIAVNGEVLGRIHTSASAPVIDLSENGALVEIQSVLRPGAIHTLRLPLGTEEVALRCRVVRSFIHGFDRTREGEEAVVRYRAALEFVGLTEKEREVLRKHLATPGATGDFDLDLDE